MTDSSMEILRQIRQYCGQYFDATNSATNKHQLNVDLCRFLSSSVPALCKRVCTNSLDKEGSVVELQSPVYVFGDLHGSVNDLLNIENLFWKSDDQQLQSATNYCFLGDYVDRGPHSVEVAVHLLALKDLLPNQFTLLRGNHEVRSINKDYTFYKECLKKFGHNTGCIIWDLINKCFERLPFVAIIDQSFFCCHGGIPKSATTLDQLRAIPKLLVDPCVCPPAQELIWNDPIESMTSYSATTEQSMSARGSLFTRNRARNIGNYFTAAAVQRFLDTNGLTFIIRAHECFQEGYRFASAGKLVTVFSAYDYCGKGNTTACAQVMPDSVRIIILREGRTPKSHRRPTPPVGTNSSTYSDVDTNP